MLCALAPVWASRFLPLLDEPNHLSALYIWKHLADPASPLHEFYEPAIKPVSYLLDYSLSYVLSFPFGVEVAHKLSLSLYVVSLPLAALCWCRATGRSEWLSLMTMPLAFSASWAHGYHPFNAGVAACLFAIVVQDALLRTPTPGKLAGSAALGVLCYFGHPLALGLYWLCTVALWDILRPRLSTIALSALSLAPSLACYRWQSRAAHLPPGSLRTALSPWFPVMDPQIYKARLYDLGEHAMSWLPGTYEGWFFAVVVVSAVVLFVAGLRRKASYRGLALAFVLLAAYLVLPEHLDFPIYLWIARGRVAPLIVFFLLLSPAVSENMKMRWLAACAAGVAMLIPLSLARAYHRFGESMKALEHTVASCPEGEQILTLAVGEHEQPVKGFRVPVFRELPSWVQLLHGGFNPSQFERPVPFPFSTKKALPAPFWRAQDAYAHLMNPNVFGCVLTKDLPQLGFPEQYHLVRREGAFALYRANPTVAAPDQAQR